MKWILLLIALAELCFAGVSTVPTRFSFRGQNWTIIKEAQPETSKGAVLGYTWYKFHIVALKKGLPCDEYRVLLMHELVHVAAQEKSDISPKGDLDYWLEEQDEEHQRVDIGLAQLAAENPEVWKWIGEGCR